MGIGRSIVTLGLALGIAVSVTWAEESRREGGTALEQDLARALSLVHRGAFEQATVALQQVVDRTARTERHGLQADALLALAKVHLTLGYPPKAAQELELALALARAARDPRRQAAALAALGQVYVVQGQSDGARATLEEALASAEAAGAPSLEAAVLNDRGQLLAREGKYREGLADFTRSASLARAGETPSMRTTAMLNAGRAALRLGRTAEAESWFDRVLAPLWDLPPSREKALGLIALGLAYREVHEAGSAGAGERLATAARVLEEAGEVAKAIGDDRAASYAWGHRGRLYEERGRVEEALVLTRLAVLAAQRVYAPESLYRWEWQMGRLLNADGRIDDAIAAYQRATETIQTIRPELVLATADQASAFRESGGRLYFELADLLLQRAAAAPDAEAAQPYLVGAREAVELFKSTELRDYFGDDCVDALQERTVPIERVVARGTAVVYPILLSDRTEVLISLQDGIRRVAVPVDAGRMTEEVRRFRSFLEKRTTREFLPHARQLYDWLIRPVEPVLTSHEVRTLVVVPDAALRTIPFAALHDGERFLIERFAVATTPGLDLTDPRPLPRANIRVLAAGLTEGVQGFSPLPHVQRELVALETLYQSDQLVDRRFLISTFEEHMRERRFTIVHIASHGEFASDVENSFVLTFDDRMTMDRLNEIVGYFQFRQEPLELLTLSACETAAGDDRAALGLAGVAIKAGARSALATLWFINDEASSALVAEFYRQLRDSSLSKAEALQRAQVTLLERPGYAHPSYWAPFLLLNNWL